jgi:signal transduction histidine kinase
VTFAANQPIFRQGDPGDGIYFVKEGLVLISTAVGHGDLMALTGIPPGKCLGETAALDNEPRRTGATDDQPATAVLTRIPPGEFFGEMAVLDNEPRSASATAEQPTSVYFISRLDLLRVLEQTPRLASALVREISRRLRAFNDQYIREVFEAERLQLVGRFASSIVHDLKNPLNIIGISADMAGMASATMESRQLAKVRIRKQVERISNMVSELLEFTQGTRANFVLAQMPYNTFVEPLIQEIQQEIALKVVKLQYVNPAPSTLVRVNPQRLSRVFHNLIGNAADAMSGGGAIRLRFSENGRELATELEDTGKGIAPQILDRLFQAFATYGKANGTGLGLSICKKIVQDHHGRIYARNMPNGGALFGFTLPLPSEEPRVF